ncbi:MAG: DUF309 domain-containing protein [Thermodesulfobacteriota bacterium]
MKQENFNPFLNRDDRLVRNTLGRAFCRILENGAPFADDTLSTAAERLLTEASPTQRCYIMERRRRYALCLATMTSNMFNDPLHQAFVLWDAELFFEVHEVLERVWTTATGRAKSALQGLIRAAGVYMLLEGNRRKAALKMAAKAAAAIAADHQALPFCPGVELLLVGLTRLDPRPPKLLTSQHRADI